MRTVLLLLLAVALTVACATASHEVDESHLLLRGNPRSSFSWDRYGVDCSNYNGENGCQGNQTDMDPAKANRQWQTPPRGDASWMASYQDYNGLVGWTTTVYSADRQAATVTVNAIAKNKSASLTYIFNGKPTSSNVFQANNSTVTGDYLTVGVTSSDNLKLDLEPVYFSWNANRVNQGSQYEGGQKGAIVEMFGWGYADIEAECEMLGKAGYLGVKVFPPQETMMSSRWLQNGEINPWYWAYQPVSYKMNNRQGTRDQLRSMIQTCRKNNVRVYADAVVNHMTGGGNDSGPHRNGNGGGCAYWGPKDSTAGSPFYTQDFNYAPSNFTNQHPGLEYPAVPYGPLDFHCERSLNSWSDPLILNAGWLVGLSDLNTERPNVQQRIADYFTDLIGIGFSGFRIDAAKHIKPDDLAAIFAIFKKNMGGSFPDDFITYLEVIIGGEKDLLECDSSSTYTYSLYFNKVMAAAGLSDSDIGKVKIWSSDYPKEFPICGYWIIPSERFAVENDCHDDQFPGSSSRDMGDKGSVLVKQKDVHSHRYFEQQLFTRTDGNWKIKLLLSSYTFMDYGAYGFPDGFSDCKLCTGPDCGSCRSMAKATAHDPNVCGYTVYNNGSWAQGVYTRTHRDLSIIKAMRQWMGLPTNVGPTDVGLPSQCQENSP